MVSEAKHAKVSVSTDRFLFHPKQKNQTLEIRNHSQTVPVTFKLKTSTPKSYTVKPRMGFVDAGCKLAITVSVRLEGGERGASFKDSFRLETRGLSDEEVAQRKQQTGQKEQNDFVAWLWKTVGLQTSKFRVDSFFDEAGDFSAAAALSPKTPTGKGDETPAPQTAAAPVSPATGGGNVAQQIEAKRQTVSALRKEVDQLEAEREQISRNANQHQIMAEEMRSKETGGAAVPLALFIVMWFAAFYAGLVLPKYMDALTKDAAASA
eukprot:TRINITY_DN2514_c0_g1_i1.p1 TRINITY_DN2514_c0_g1~~TRINITY_DN2514_c0_g1_i1.p1  ORF type:complete len:265 (+),score=111.90 TRINITY_DN2514_c0_g1_i1:48-842(+)